MTEAGRPIQIEVPDISAWGLRDCLDGERRSLGFCLSGHPFDECRHEARSFVGGSLREILDRAQPGRPEERNDTVIVVAGSVLRKWRRAGANYFDLDDGQTRLPVRLPRWDSGAPPAPPHHSAFAGTGEGPCVSSAARLDQYVRGFSGVAGRSNGTTRPPACCCAVRPTRNRPKPLRN